MVATRLLWVFAPVLLLQTRPVPADAPKAAASTPASVPAGTAAPVVVWSNDFQDSVNPEGWQSTPASTPGGDERFLGEFTTGGEPVRFRLRSLPPHTFLRVAFDLYIMKSWDGNVREVAGDVIGPDIWEASIDGGPMLIHTTFALFTRDGGRQAFPDDYPYGDHAHCTGARSINSLGFSFDGHPMDAVYHVDLAFPHTADCAQFIFRTVGPAQNNIGDESWGLDNFQVVALSQAPGRDMEESAIEVECSRLAGEDAVQAFAAVWKLISAGDRAVPILRRTLRPQPIDEKRVKEHLTRLDDPVYKVRQEAASALERLGPPVAPRLQAALAAPHSVEAASRLRSILASIDGTTLSGVYALQHARAIRVLEVIGSASATACLKEWAERSPSASIRTAAREALARIGAAGKRDPAR